jgi:uncharacterized cofD-like protein
MANTVLTVGNKKFTDDVSAILSHMISNVASVSSLKEAAKACLKEDVKTILLDCDSYKGVKDYAEISKLVVGCKKELILFTCDRKISRVLAAKRMGASDLIIKPYNEREFIARFNAVVHRKTRISCLGGGTGLLNLLMGLKTIPNTHLTSIVSISDDGGSSGRLRASFGILPPGDIRRSLVALSNAPGLMNQVMQYRFEKGVELNGHNFGNLFLTALAEIKGSIIEAVKELADILYIQGIVLPIAKSQTTLCAEFEDGTIVKGESKIDLCEDRNPRLAIKKLWHEPEQECDVDAYSCILNSDIVTIGPGDLFTSVATNLLIKNVADAIKHTKAKKIYISNLMTKPGETSGFDACRHVEEIVRYMGGDYLDYVIVSNTRLSSKAIKEYAKKGQIPVKLGGMERMRKITNAKIIVADVSHETELVRHDETKIKFEIMKIVEAEGLHR